MSADAIKTAVQPPFDPPKQYSAKSRYVTEQILDRPGSSVIAESTEAAVLILAPVGPQRHPGILLPPNLSIRPPPPPF